jgi:heat shock protein HtpX
MLFYSRSDSWSPRRSDGDRRGSGGAAIAIVIALALIALAWFLSIVIRFALSRSREYLADAGSVELTKNPDAMILALRKIEGRGELPDSPSSVMEMCVDNPRTGFSDLFATHPSIDRRIEALIRVAGGHDPGPIALPDIDDDGAQDPAENDAGDEQTAAPPQPGGDKPFLPSVPPLSTGAPASQGPWGPIPPVGPPRP